MGRIALVLAAVATLAAIGARATGGAGADAAIKLRVATRLAPPTTNFTILTDFVGNTGGASPLAALILDSSGNLYGTTSEGGDMTCGPESGCGTVFMLSPIGRQTVLYSFEGGRDGAHPQAGLVRDPAGDLFGTTIQGGGTSKCFNGCGTVFEVNASGQESVLYRFTGRGDGASPDATLILDAKGNLYGTTSYGGAADCASNGMGCGVIFRLDSSGKETVQHSFTGGADGSYPQAPLLRDAQGDLYGTASEGGDYHHGTVFKLDAEGKLTVLHAFVGADGAVPLAGLIRDAAGNFYGTTYEGGDPVCDCGVVFELNTSGREIRKYALKGGAGGTFPFGGVIRDSLGNVYGTTNGGGDANCGAPYGCGVVFEVDPTGTETVLYTFTGGGDGAHPAAGLVGDGKGNAYGTAVSGGDSYYCSGGCGTAFEISQ